MALNEKQQLFFNEIKKGKNTLLSGEAGTGKSFCIKALIDELINRNAPFGVTATTGVAALNIGGATIHSWMGIGLGEDDADFLLNRIRKMTPIKMRILKTKVLIIDEISMMPAELFDKIDYIFKKIKNNKKPFGGIQLILSGDFLQTPVVSRTGEGLFAFESKAWEDGGIAEIELTEQVRQKNDGGFAKILSEVRVGNTTSLRSLLQEQPVFPDDGIKPIYLYCLNRFVEKHNEEEVSKLEGTEKKYYASTKGDKKDVETLTRSCPAIDIVKLKKGAQVILLQNIDVEGGLVNGSLGVVKELKDGSVVVKFENGDHEVERYAWELKKQSIGEDGGTKFRVAASFNQIPLKLAYSITTHKCLGLTLNRVILDGTGIFDHGLAYVALSRVRDRNSLIIKNLNINKVTAHPKALEFYGYKVPDKIKEIELDDDPFEW